MKISAVVTLNQEQAKRQKRRFSVLRMHDGSAERRIDAVLRSRKEGWSYRKIAEEFNCRHPNRQPVCFTAVRKLINKFEEAGSVLDKRRSRRPKMSDETKETVLAKVYTSPRKSLCRTSTALSVAESSIHTLTRKVPSVQNTDIASPKRRRPDLQMFEWLDQLAKNINFTKDSVLLSN